MFDIWKPHDKKRTNFYILSSTDSICTPQHVSPHTNAKRDKYQQTYRKYDRGDQTVADNEG